MVEMFEFKVLHNHEMTCIDTTTRQKGSLHIVPNTINTLQPHTRFVFPYRELVKQELCFTLTLP